ncbi:mitochondrial PGP phosphatase-domain-containing protein [Piptocephalis cylindrospora]|uniref:Mitochondrial PGP phosphatase-domain-containing protein n=1 Tax=Piptocephalis cylindrospora TaxID=1907219 RepID=A0A4P9XZV1_9FUNG|nr:mitochondrial PGP phosphatase-domain-containing protein [Piptocephalis cylindrospora]|eukprot:RKP11985.1 mitochondrial PGP phosphatase-domain-containing protein [Piptocephalis cylindrospora]
MGQSWNFAGILSFLSVLRRPQLAVPHFVIPNLAYLRVNGLRECGVKAVAFDKDNTLTRPYSNSLEPEFETTWKECQKVFGKDNLVIISNSIGTDDDPGHVQVSSGMSVQVLCHQDKKPAGSQVLLDHFPGLKPGEIAMVGDRILTDIAYGHRAGAVTILTRQVISIQGDNPAAALVGHERQERMMEWDRMGRLTIPLR